MNVGANVASYAEPIKMPAKTPVKAEPKVAAPVPEKETVQPSSTGYAAAQQDIVGKEKKEENESRRLKSAVDHANTTMKHAKTKCEFSYHEDTKRVSIKVIDEDTKEVIKEIPPEETLEMIAKMWELAGILVDEKR